MWISARTLCFPFWDGEYPGAISLSRTLCYVLGVQLDLKQSGDKLCRVSNIEERLEGLTKEISEVLERW